MPSFIPLVRVKVPETEQYVRIKLLSEGERLRTSAIEDNQERLNELAKNIFPDGKDDMGEPLFQNSEEWEASMTTGQIAHLLAQLYARSSGREVADFLAGTFQNGEGEAGGVEARPDSEEVRSTAE